MTGDPAVTDLIARAEARAAAGRTGEAHAILRAALDRRRDDLALLFATGCMALRAGAPAEAVAFLRVVAARMPGVPPVATAYAQALTASGAPDLGERIAREGLRGAPGYAPLREALAAALADRQDHDGACAAYADLLADRPDDPGLLANLAEAHAHAGRWAEASALFERAVAAAPGDMQLRLNRATFRLAAGDGAGGWPDWECRLAPERGRAVVRDHALPRWDGTPGRTGLLVEAEQGVGEQVLFAACLPEAAARAGHLVVECDPRLVPVYRRSFPGTTVHAFDRRTEGPPPIFGYGWLADVPAVSHHVEVGSLPALLGVDLATPPARTPYLIPDPDRTAALRARYRALGAGPVVGLTWRSRNVRHGRAKSLGVEDLAAIARARPDAVFVSLQYGTNRGDVDALAAQGVRLHVDADVDPMVDLDAHLAQVAAVDVALGASNTALHLAAAAGRPVWVLTAGGRGQLWYWGDAGGSARWYPGVRVFRQAAAGAWDAPVGAVCEALRAL